MPMPPEVQKALAPMKPAGGAPPTPPPGPAAAGMMTPQKPQGQIENGKLKVLTCMKQLESSLPMFELKSKEWTTVLDALKSLSKTFGKSEGDTEELLASEKKTVAGSLPGGPGGAPPQGPPPGAGGGGPPAMPPQPPQG